MSAPLEGIKVVEFSGIGPAPLAGQLLADMGADVITIDRKSAKPDPTDVNRRGKRSLAIDLKSTEGKAAVLGPPQQSSGYVRRPHTVRALRGLRDRARR